MSNPAPKRPTPRVFSHANHADWGRGVISEELPDRKTFVFEHVGVRTFMNVSSVIIEENDVPQEERNALAASLIRVSSGAAPLKKKRKAPTKKPAAPKAPKAAAPTAD